MIPTEIKRALDNGITQEEIIEISTTLAFSSAGRPLRRPSRVLFRYSAICSQELGRKASCSVNPDLGESTSLETYPLVNTPGWLPVTELPGY